MPSWRLSENIETKLQAPGFASYKAFLKKKGLELVSLPRFLHDFLK